MTRGGKTDFDISVDKKMKMKKKEMVEKLENFFPKVKFNKSGFFAK